VPKRAVCDLESQLNWWAKKNYEEGRLSDSRRLNGNDVTKKVVWNSKVEFFEFEYTS